MMPSISCQKPSGWFSQCATSMDARLKKFVTSWQFPRLIRGYCSTERGRKYVAFWKIIMRIQARSLKKGQNVADVELTCKELTELITDYLEDQLPHAERVRIEEHLSVCPA